MKHFVLALCICYMLAVAAVAKAADAGACYTVQDADARTYCLARAHSEPAQCYAIQKADMRSKCLAEVRK